MLWVTTCYLQATPHTENRKWLRSCEPYWDVVGTRVNAVIACNTKFVSVDDRVQGLSPRFLLMSQSLIFTENRRLKNKHANENGM